MLSAVAAYDPGIWNTGIHISRAMMNLVHHDVQICRFQPAHYIECGIPSPKFPSPGSISIRSWLNDQMTQTTHIKRKGKW